MLNWLTKSTLWLFGGSNRGNVQTANVGNGYRMFTGGNELPIVDEASSLAISAVFACVNLIARNLATLPFSVYKESGGASIKNSTHPLHFLIHDQPNSVMTSFDWRCAVFANELLWGNAFTYIQFDVTGKPIALYPLRSDRMSVEVEGADVSYVYSTGNRKVRYATNEIIHHRHFTLDGVMGVSPIEQARRTLQMSQAVERFGTALFANGARPSGVLTHPGQLTVEAANRLRENFDRNYSGSDKAGKLIVLEEGLQYSQISINPVDAEFLASRKFQVSEICRIFGVPEALVGQIDRPTYGSLADMKDHFMTFTLLPIIKSFEQSVNSKLFGTGSQHYAQMNFDGFLRSDMKTRYEAYQIGRTAGILSPNECREWENLPPIEGGDTYIEPLNHGPLGSREKVPEVVA